MTLIDFRGLITKESFDSIVESYQSQVKNLPKLQPVVFSQGSVRSVLLERDAQLRQLLSPSVKTPALSYILSGDAKKLLVTISRKSKQVGYKDFVFRLGVTSDDLNTLKSFQEGVFQRLLIEGLLLENISGFNDIINSALERSNSPLSVIFTPDTFGNQYVEFISDSQLVLTADSSSLLDLVGKANVVGFSSDTLISSEFNSLSVCQSTVELLGRKSPLIKYLLSSGKLGLTKLLKPVFNKTTKQLSTYKTAKGYGYYLNDNVFGVVKRTEFGVEVVVSPINISTFQKDSVLDLVKEVE